MRGKRVKTDPLTPGLHSTPRANSTRPPQKQFPSRSKPGVVDGIAANLDLYATFATLAGGELPKDKPGFISMDLTPALLHGEPSPRSWWLYHSTAYRSGKYKIHTGLTLPTEPNTRKKQRPPELKAPLLFDLENDIGEQTDIAAQHPDIVEKLLGEMAARLKSLASHCRVQGPVRNTEKRLGPSGRAATFGLLARLWHVDRSRQIPVDRRLPDGPGSLGS